MPHRQLLALAVKARAAARLGRSVLMSVVLFATAGHAAVLYTFSNGGANPYSFSFLELNPLTTTGAFAIAPFQAGGLTFTQADLVNSGGTSCFQFGTAGASLTATNSSCGVAAFAPEGGWQSLFFGVSGPGSYTAFNAASQGSAPVAPDQLTIQNVAALQYTFSKAGANPYSFSFLELNPITATGAFAIAPFQVGGLTFTQADLVASGATDCFQFGTAGASLTATNFTCGVAAFAPEGGWQSLFFGITGPGTYTAFNAASQGSAPAAPDILTIVGLSGSPPPPPPPPPPPVGVPEPSGLALIFGGLAVLVVSRRRRQCSVDG